ncbi:MAG TPA: polysaccharide biosynthesis/export family protein [Pseudomonadales bacterium]|nr:polysaccharide biosynthesis/export family protein [Pseudomonadales bacterium]
MAVAADTMSEYKLGAGDKISIYVFDEPDLSMEYTLSGAGTISYPFLGEIRVLGMTVGELENRIVTGLKGGYLVDPKINVTIKEYRQFFIQGEVTKSGGYPYQPGLTLRKAISVAGGLTERASEKKIFVIREDDPSKQKKAIGLDEPVYAGDSVTVEQSFF